MCADVIVADDSEQTVLAVAADNSMHISVWTKHNIQLLRLRSKLPQKT